MRIKSDNPEFDRDMSSMGLINNNVNEYHAYVQRRESVMQSKSKAQDVIKDVEVLKNDMQEIKSLLHELIRK
jgi:hypothetical protein|tara:strand:- start:309 stop:524 length:216 start_codon:yes stop_codon:yes gene_type:complete